MSIQFWETVMGRRLIEGTIPKIVDQLDRLNANLERISGAAAATHVAFTDDWAGHLTRASAALRFLGSSDSEVGKANLAAAKAIEDYVAAMKELDDVLGKRGGGGA